MDRQREDLALLEPTFCEFLPVFLQWRVLLVLELKNKGINVNTVRNDNLGQFAEYRQRSDKQRHEESGR